MRDPLNVVVDISHHHGNVNLAKGGRVEIARSASNHSTLMLAARTIGHHFSISAL
jgi:hypothetical protein